MPDMFLRGVNQATLQAHCDSAGLLRSAFREELGKHGLVDYQISPEAAAKISAEELRYTLEAAADAAEATRLLSQACEDEEGNLSAIVVIQESHLSMHLNRKTGKVVVDYYTCRDIKSSVAEKFLVKELNLKRISRKIRLYRGLHSEGNNFIPGIAQLPKKNNPTFFNWPAPDPANVNVHLHRILELYRCDEKIINDGNRVIDIFCEALFYGKTSRLAKHFSREYEDFRKQLFVHKHQFEPHGLSTVVMGPGFHITTHTWPEYHYAPVDIYSQDKLIDLDRVTQYINEKLHAKTAVPEEDMAMIEIPRTVLARSQFA